MVDFSSNVLLDAHFNAKIGDFGFTIEMPKSLSDSVTLKTAACIAKTLGYAAPEIDTCRHSLKSDVYSYGVVQYVLCSHSIAMLIYLSDVS